MLSRAQNIFHHNPRITRACAGPFLVIYEIYNESCSGFDKYWLKNSVVPFQNANKPSHSKAITSQNFITYHF